MAGAVAGGAGAAAGTGAAFASAPLVLAYPLFLVIFGRSAWTIIVMAFIAGLAPVILKTIEGLSGTRRVLINVGKSFKLTPRQQGVQARYPFLAATARSSHWLDFRYTDSIRAGGMPTAPPVLTAGFRGLLQAVQSHVTSVGSPG